MKDYRPLIIIALAAGLIISGLSDPMSFSSSTGSSTHMTSNSQGLAGLATISLVALLAPRRILPTIEGTNPSRLRRWTSVLIDIIFFVMSIVFFSFCTTLVTEWIATGQWQWAWRNPEQTWRDNAMVIPLLTGFYLLHRRLKHSLTSGRPTLGQYLLNIRIIANGPVSDVTLKDFLLTYLALGPTIFGLIRKLARRRGKVPDDHWSKQLRTRAVSTRAP
jgi:hypothetical protein